MRAIRTALFACLVATTACGGGDSKAVDAMVIIPDAAPDAPPDAFEPTFDLSCVGNTQGAAAANVTLSGFAAEIVINGIQPDIAPAHNATVDVCKASSTTCLTTDKLDTKTTPMNGCPATGCPFTSASLATGGTPLDVYAKITKAGNYSTYVYPSAPVIANQANIPGVMFTQNAITLLNASGLVTQADGKGILLVAVTDCANMPITEQVTLTIKQNGQVVPGTDSFDLSQVDPMLAGTYAIFNVAAGPDAQTPSALTEVSGTYKTTALRTHEVRVFRNSTTGTQLRPGF